MHNESKFSEQQLCQKHHPQAVRTSGSSAHLVTTMEVTSAISLPLVIAGMAMQVTLAALHQVLVYKLTQNLAIYLKKGEMQKNE